MGWFYGLAIITVIAGTIVIISPIFINNEGKRTEEPIDK